MSDNRRSESGAIEGPSDFVTTRWSQVIAAARQDTRARSALENLCRVYWHPLYVYVRRRGHAPEDARDLTQAFFEKLLERGWIGHAEREKGRFRTFLLTAMERFLANEWHKARALKRGGGQPLVPIQLDAAETRYGIDPADSRTPESEFDYRWAVMLLEAVFQKLEVEFRGRGQGELFDTLKICLVGERRNQPYAELAGRLSLTEGAVKVAVHRLRQRYRELLRAEIASTVSSPAEVDLEMHHLFQILAERV